MKSSYNIQSIIVFKTNYNKTVLEAAFFSSFRKNATFPSFHKLSDSFYGNINS